MARNGSGTYILPPSNPVVSGTVIESDWANDTMSDLAAALSQSIAYDGQTVPINNLPMGGFHHTNVSEPASRNQYATLGMVQDGRHQRLTTVSGVDNIVATLIGGATSYVAGATITFFAPATNTGAMTINYNGIGARSLTDSNGLAISPGAVQAGQFLYAIYTGTEFRLLSQIDAAVAADLYNLSITGQVRPPSDVYPALTIATGTTVNVPAGTAWIVPPGNDVDEAVQVTWAAQTITMQFLSSSFTTFVMVDETGVIQQIPGRAIGPNFRHMAVLGVVEHITGTVNNVVTRPSIFGDDGYRARDQASLLANTVVNGALVTPNQVSTLNLDVAQGTIFIPGGTANTVDSPNTFNVPPQANIQFRTLAGQNTTSALTGNVPVGSYDANGAGVIAALPNPGDATIHRLFYIYGQYVLAYGQQVYTSVENALSMIAWDRTKFKKSLYLADATLLAEVVAIRTATNLNVITQGAVVCPGGLNFSIGSPGGIAEAPIDGFPYGRRNAAWFQVLGSVNPAASGSMTIGGAAPILHFGLTPVGPAIVGYDVFSGANKWYAQETVNPDDITYFRSYDPTSGVLRHSTSYNLATGRWVFPVTPAVNGKGDLIAGPNPSTQNAIPRFFDGSGTIVKNSDVLITDTNIIDRVRGINGAQIAGLRNKFINGSFNVWQRGTGPFTTDGFGADRWQAIFAFFGHTVNVSLVTMAPNSGDAAEVNNAARVVASIVAGPPGLYRQPIEFVTTFAEKTVTMSVYVYNSSVSNTRNFQLGCVQSFGTGGSVSVGLPDSPIIPVLPQQVVRLTHTFVIPSLIGKSIGTNNFLAFDIKFIDVGATYDVLIFNAQVEYGPVATPFEYTNVALELQMCQRYFERGVVSFTGYQLASNGWGQPHIYKVTKRATPTLTYTLTTQANVTNPSIGGSDINQFGNNATMTTTGSGFHAGGWTANAEIG